MPPKEVGDRTKETYFKLFHGVNKLYNVNYFCTDKLGIYKLKRFTSVKDNKYFIADYYRRIDKRIEIIKREREKKKWNSSSNNNNINSNNNNNNNNIIKFRKINDGNKEINSKNTAKKEKKKKK